MKKLDESKIPDEGAGGTGGVSSGGTAGTGANAAGGASGSGGSGGSTTGGAAGTGASSGAGGSAGSGGAPLVPTFTEYDSSKYPANNIVSGIPDALIAADANHVFRVRRDILSTLVGRVNITGGGSTSVTDTDVDNASVLLAPAGTLYVYVGGSRLATEDVRLVRYLKDPPGGMVNTGEELVMPESPRLLASLSLGETQAQLGATEIYMTARTSAPNQPHVFRVRLDSVNVERLYTAPAANETGGPIAQRGECVYWISNGRINVMPKDGGARADALASQIGDAVGLAIDSTNFYYTRGEGSVWQRPLSDAACSGAGAPELQLVPGFTGLGDIVAYEGKIAWLADGSDYGDSGSGIFSVLAGTADIVQVAPGSADPPKNLIEVADKLVYISEFGVIARVPKSPQ